jgi:hypothetical protein
MFLGAKFNQNGEKNSGLQLLHRVFNFLNIRPKRDTGLAKFRRPALAVAGNTIFFTILPVLLPINAKSFLGCQPRHSIRK